VKRLILVRHGLTDWNEDGRLMGRHEVELNERGREQARRVAKELSTLSVTAVYASPQIRAQQTAAPLAELLKTRVIVEAAFDEVWLSSEWQGKTVDELRGDAELERVIADPMYRSESLEPIAAVQIRTTAAVERFRKRHTDGRVVIFSHGDPLRAISAHYLGMPLAQFRRLGCENGSMTIFDFNKRGPRLALSNWQP